MADRGATLEDHFDAAMMRLYQEAKKAGYNATSFLNMLHDRGGRATARKLITDSTPSDGFTKLWEMGRLDLTVEHLVVCANEYRELFAVGEIHAAGRRLEEYGWTDLLSQFGHRQVFRNFHSRPPIRQKWAKEIEETQRTAPNYPIISDSSHEIAKAYGMLPADVSGDPTDRTPADNQTLRNVFVIGPDKKIKLILVYPMTTGRNFDEVLRVIDSLQLTANNEVATPAQWQQGDDVIIAGSVSDDDAKELFPDGWETPLPYMRVVKQPK
jgi:hypothetical protein